MTEKFKYLEIYNFYKKMIAEKRLVPGSKMPSIRDCCEKYSVSRTTVQTAYYSLCADGLIYSKPQSGYYVSKEILSVQKPKNHIRSEKQEIKFDLANESADSQSFDFKLWQRYIKSALRESGRLLSYGEPQGEYDLRRAISAYLIKSRSAVCSADNIVVGAGVQSLLQVLFPLIKEQYGICGVSFSNDAYLQGKTAFSDAGFTIDHDNAQIAYLTPFRLTEKGEIMSINERIAFVKKARENNTLIIEDDYGSEFSSGRIPSCVQSITGGENTVYIGTFSKLLVPSIRISYMILPDKMLYNYRKRRNLYSQTTSKIEQLALCRFINDGHLNSQIRKIRRIYSEKSKHVCSIIEKVFGHSAEYEPTDSGRYIILKIKTDMPTSKIILQAEKHGIRVYPEKEQTNGFAGFIISFYGIDENNLQNALESLREITDNKSKE